MRVWKWNEMNALLIIGRVLFALIFINSGYGHIKNLAAMTGYAQYKKVPAAKLSVIASGLMLLAGGLSVLLGVWVDLGALLLVVFLIPTAILMHNFWTIEDAMAKAGDAAQFFKNIALAGAALILFAILHKVGADHDAIFGSHVGSLLLWK